MSDPLAGVDTSDAPYIIVSSDTHAGLQVEEYREYLDPRFREQFDEWVVERHNHRRLMEEVNGDYVAQWESENEVGLRGAYDPEIRDKELDSDGISAEIIFADRDLEDQVAVFLEFLDLDCVGILDQGPRDVEKHLLHRRGNSLSCRWR